MKLTVIIVNYNVKYYLEQCLTSVRRSIEGIDGEVVVVDNHSRDGSVEYLKERFPDVRFIESNHNLGFARANNLAIRQSGAEYVLLLNPDTLVGEHTFRDILEFMDEHPKAGAAGVQMLKTNGEKAKESRRGLPTPMTAFYKMTGLCERFPKHQKLGHYYMGNLPWDKPAKIEVISGAFMMIRRSVLDTVGFLDEDFFMYGEDIDLSYRILKAGYENWYVPEKILHYKGESTEKSSFRYVHVFYKAMLIFFRKHYGSIGLWLSIPIRAAIYGKAFTDLARMEMRKLKKRLGFVEHKKDDEATFIFDGSEQMRQECILLARRKGLSCEKRGNEFVYHVYDMDSWCYADIFNDLANHEGAYLIGTYSSASRVLITDKEVYV